MFTIINQCIYISKKKFDIKFFWTSYTTTYEDKEVAILSLSITVNDGIVFK